MRQEPLGQTIICKARKVEEKVGSIILPDTVKRDETVVVIVAVGPDVKDKKLVPGALIILPTYASRKHELEGEEYLTADAEDIKVVLVDDDQNEGESQSD